MWNNIIFQKMSYPCLVVILEIDNPDVNQKGHEDRARNSFPDRKLAGKGLKGKGSLRVRFRLGKIVPGSGILGNKRTKLRNILVFC